MVAVQHGMVYSHTPEYVYPPHPGVLRPDVTCTFGADERDLLVTSAGYPADAVVARARRGWRLMAASPRHPTMTGPRSGASWASCRATGCSW